MFEDSKTTKSCPQGSTKISYNKVAGLAPFVKNLLIEGVNKVKYYSLLFL